MLLCHCHLWHNVTPTDNARMGANICLKRLTVDLLLPGPTTLDQIKAVVAQDGKSLFFAHCAHGTYLSADRTAVCVADAFGGARALGTAGLRETMAAANRVQAHRTALETIRPEQQEKVCKIDLPFKVDHNFCRRDDWGWDNRTHGIKIGMHRHDNDQMRAANQCVWILHVELSAKERPFFEPTSPGGFGDFAAYA